MRPFVPLIGDFNKREDLPGVSFKDNVSEWLPAKGTDLGIYGKVIAVQQNFA